LTPFIFFQFTEPTHCPNARNKKIVDLSIENGKTQNTTTSLFGLNFVHKNQSKNNLLLAKYHCIHLQYLTSKILFVILLRNLVNVLASYHGCFKLYIFILLFTGTRSAARFIGFSVIVPSPQKPQFALGERTNNNFSGDYTTTKACGETNTNLQ
jgi:hypothetical protein